MTVFLGDRSYFWLPSGTVGVIDSRNNFAEVLGGPGVESLVLLEATGSALSTTSGDGQ